MATFGFCWYYTAALLVWQTINQIISNTHAISCLTLQLCFILDFLPEILWSNPHLNLNANKKYLCVPILDNQIQRTFLSVSWHSLSIRLNEEEKQCPTECSLHCKTSKFQTFSYVNQCQCMNSWIVHNISLKLFNNLLSCLCKGVFNDLEHFWLDIKIWNMKADVKIWNGLNGFSFELDIGSDLKLDHQRIVANGVNDSH